PRPFGSIANVSGMLDRPLSRAMTTADMTSHSRSSLFARGERSESPESITTAGSCFKGRELQLSRQLPPVVMDSGLAASRRPGMTRGEPVGPPSPLSPQTMAEYLARPYGARSMDRDRAAEIQKHLLEASDALDRVTEAMFKLDKDERKAFAEVLFEIHDALHFGLLRALYAEHPELRPPDEPPHISSTLRWKDVSLP